MEKKMKCKTGFIYTIYVPYNVREKMRKLNNKLAKKNDKINWSNVATKAFVKVLEQYS